MSEHESLPGYPPRLRLLIAIALALAFPVVVWAVVSIALDPPGGAEALAITLFLGLALLAELNPVPLEEDDLSTVSLALRDHPSIPPSTRARIRAVAKEFGYQRDPLLDAGDSGYTLPVENATMRDDA